MMVMMVMMLLPMVILLMTLRRGFNRKEPAVTSLEAKFTVSLSSFIWICVYKLFLTVKVMSKSLPWWILQDSIDEGVGIKDDDEDDDDDDGDFKAEQGRQLTETMPQFLELLVDSSPGCVFFLFYFSSIAVFILTVLICSLLQLTSFQAVFISTYFTLSKTLLCKDPLSENFWTAPDVTFPQCSMMSHSINVHCMWT